MPLPALTTAGADIVRRDTGEPVILRGVNRSGLEYAAPDQHGITAAELDEITGPWNARILRLPFNQDWVLHRPGYLETLDQVIAQAAERGAYTLLDLQWINTEIKIAPLPDLNSPRTWTLLAERYRDNPAVLYDLYNEPHDAKPADWRYWATLLTDTIRDRHPEALLFVSGMNWGYDLREVELDRDHIVYSTHVYPNKTRDLDPFDAFGHRAGEVPLFAGEWGGWDHDLAWGEELAVYFDQIGMGWTAWSWCDEPHLKRNGASTPFGDLVRSWLTRETLV
jgi:endoglucanase